MTQKGNEEMTERQIQECIEKIMSTVAEAKGNAESLGLRWMALSLLEFHEARDIIDAKGYNKPGRTVTGAVRLLPPADDAADDPPGGVLWSWMLNAARKAVTGDDRDLRLVMVVIAEHSLATTEGIRRNRDRFAAYG